MKKDDHEVEWSEHSAIYYIELAVQAEPAWAGISPVEAKFSDEGAGLVSSVYSLDAGTSRKITHKYPTGHHYIYRTYPSPIWI